LNISIIFKRNCILKFEPETISLDLAHSSVKIQNMQIPRITRSIHYL
jgi:hypothetical protein